MSDASRPFGAASCEMPTTSDSHRTAAAAEQVLDGDTGHPRLQQLLAAATAPASEHELTGEAAALLAFRLAAQERSLPSDTCPLPSDPSRRMSMSRMLLSKLLATKALVALAVAAGATGGVALAATSTPAGAHSPTAPSVTALPTTHPTAGNGRDASLDPTTDPAASADPAAPSPSLSLPGLCHAWAAGATDNRGHAATNPAFSALVTAAGGPDAVTAFCAQLAAATAAARPTDRPAPTATPVATTAPASTKGRVAAPGAQRPVPAGAAADHATGSDAPGAAPTTPAHPTGPPAGVGRSAADHGRQATN